MKVLDRLTKKRQGEAEVVPRGIYFAETRDRDNRLRDNFAKWHRDNSHNTAAETLERDWERMTTYYDFSKEHWCHQRTINPVALPFATLRLRADAAKRYKWVDRAMAVIWKLLMVAKQRFRRVKCPELMTDVYLGTRYVDGVFVEETVEKVAA